jgi:hypothetical protein
MASSARACPAESTPAALTHDQLVPAGGELADHDRLEEADLLDRRPQLLQRLLVEDLPRLLRVRFDRGDRDLPEPRTWYGREIGILLVTAGGPVLDRGGLHRRRRHRGRRRRGSGHRCLLRRGGRIGQSGGDERAKPTPEATAAILHAFPPAAAPRSASCLAASK